MELEWWHWAVAGIVLILAELAVPAFVLVWFGLGALLVALVVALAAIGVTAQLSVWLVVSLLLVFLWFKVFRPERHKTRIGMSAPAMIGEIGLLARDVAPFEKGEVRFQKPLLGTDTWPCIADEAIRAGDRVRVIAVEGSLLKVGRMS
ncbi:MAG: NfeD family protein [Gammaproteobacteria bacterium]|nr:NfeD family protein [Gammaproteobacteria bacterium]MBU1414975.1 NfeD family protein [Gammaproteobacteria bacterium]